VEVYRVNDAQLRGLDRLEGHPTFYERRRTDVVVDGKLVDAWMYFIVGGFDYHPKELVSCY
jgi:gamma-glutamylaminecyclotransferase